MQDNRKLLTQDELLAQVEALVADGHGWYMTDGECAMIREAVSLMQDDLTEAQRRADAAVKDLRTAVNKTGKCYGCLYYAGAKCTHGEYKKTCDTDKNNHWEWRGPQEAGGESR